MEEADWAITEFAAALLGDSQRTDRLIAAATVLGQRPAASIPAACDDPAMRKGIYRFFENAAIDPAAILASHIAASWERVAPRPVVLAVQDTTDLDFSRHPATTGLGPVGPVGPWVTYGLLAHTTLAVTPEGLPLGLLAQEVWTRPESDGAPTDGTPLPKTTPPQKTKRKTAKRPADARESRKWLTSLAAVGAGRAAAPQTTLISVGDREADFYDLFAAARPPGVELLVRAHHDRWVRVASDEHKYIHSLRTVLATAPIAGQRAVVVSRQVGQPARPATVTVRWLPVTLRPPDARRNERPPVPVWAIWAHEEQPPAGVEPLDWLLLPTVPLATPAAALECVEWYVCRWVIEVWHHVWKSGCAIELRHRAAPVGQCAESAARPRPLQRDRLAAALRDAAGACDPRPALHRPAGGGRRAGPVLRDPPDAAGPGHAAPRGAGGALAG